MTTRNVVNTTASDVMLSDIGVLIGASATVDGNAIGVESLMRSVNFQSAINGGTLKITTDSGDITTWSNALSVLSRAYHSSDVDLRVVSLDGYTSFLNAVDETLFINTISSLLASRYPVLLKASTPGFLVIDGKLGLTDTPQKINLGYFAGAYVASLSSSTDVTLDLMDTSVGSTTWVETGLTGNGSFARSSTQKQQGSYSYCTTITKGRPEDLYGIVKTFSSTSWATYTAVKFYVRTAQKEKVSFAINGVVVPGSEIVVGGPNTWVEVIVDISGVARSAVTSFGVFVKPNGSTYNLLTYFDNFRLSSALNYGASKHAWADSATLTTKSDIKQVYIHGEYSAPAGTSVTMEFSIDGGTHYYTLTANQWDQWLDVTTLGVAWGNKKNLTIGWDQYASTDGLSTPKFYGCFGLCRL